MKTWILAIMMMTGVVMNAQHGERKMDRMAHNKERHEQLTPEQRTKLKSKQLTLALSLTDKQQKEVQKLILDRETKKQEFVAQRKANKEAGKELTADERFAMKNKMLDGQIALQREMKKILTPEQFEKFEKIKAERHENGPKRGDHSKNARRK
jgi:periplasmic protein CpxP/Spy